MTEKTISQAVIARLPRYYRYLGELMENNIERISSNELSKRMKVTASQIRQDLNNFGGFGQQGYGYNVEYLRNDVIVGPAPMPGIPMLVVVVHTRRYERIAVSLMQHDIIRHNLQ